jgi:hypothetical protein
VQAYLNGLVTTLTATMLAEDKRVTFCDLLQPYNMQNFLGSTGLRDALCAQVPMKVPNTTQSGSIDTKIGADFLAALSQLFAWQLGGTILDAKYAAAACNKDIEHLKSGLDLIGMDVAAFTDVFCKQFQTDLPPAGYVQKMSGDLLTQLYGTVLFGLSHDERYQCALCQDFALDHGKFGEVGLNVSDWTQLRLDSCGVYGYSDAYSAKC